MFVMKIDYSREGMGGRKPTAVHLCKTGWKPAMEHYFVHLMLDQVHRGNRMGHTFNKQAWNEMLVLFNSSFGIPYAVHTLKSHYTRLWKQFNDIKSLLDQDGFSWDNTQKMVIADKKAWAAYLKVHPDAKFYRNKALTTFNDLCLIYAHTNANGRYSLSSHDTEFYDDLKALIEGVTMNTPTPAPAPASKVPTDTDWKPAMDPFFLRLMLDQLEKGRKINNTFKKQAWKDMVTLFNTKFGSQYRKNFLKQLHKKLLKYYTDLKGILATRGFHWDDRRRMILADDNVWDNYIKALPGACLYRNKPLLRYQDLNLIYGDEISNGLCNPLHQGEESEDCSFPGNGHLASFEDLDSEGQDLMIDEEGEDIQSHGNVDLSRIDWTPSMERCLMDIMLEQLQKANKIDYPFDDQAWIDVFVLFKERIGLQCDKDSFRSRYRSLEKQYHDTKDLLQHKGFCWDETEQMVSAHDNVWGAYIKEHPDVESYRPKSQPNYNDMCLIHGNSDSCDRCNQSGQAMGCNGHAKSNHNYHWRTNWTPQMDRYFIDLMLEQVRYESMLNNIFSKLAWTEMVSKFRTEFGPQHDEDDLKSRFLNLRKLFNDMKTLLDQNGFSWDEMQQMITAHGDLWDAYVKEHSDADSYRNRTLPNFNDLYLIYGNGDVPKRESSSSHFMDAEGDDSGIDVGNELKRTTSAEDDCNEAYAKEHRCSIAFENRILDNWNDMKHGNGVHDGRSGSLGTEGIIGELDSADMKFEVSDRKRKREPAASSTSASKRPPITIKEEIQETFDEKPHIIVRGLADNDEGRDCCSIESIVAALEAIPDMDDRLFLKASRVLEDERKAKMFVAMDVTARQKWLHRKLRQ